MYKFVKENKAKLEGKEAFEKDGVVAYIKEMYGKKNPLFHRRTEFFEIGQRTGNAINWSRDLLVKAREAEVDKMDGDDIIIFKMISVCCDKALKQKLKGLSVSLVIFFSPCSFS